MLRLIVLRAAPHALLLCAISSTANAVVLNAVEFYNTPIKHYFVTTNASEASGIDGGAAGPGWSRTGGTFSVYSTLAEGPSEGTASAGSTVPVCRFYARGPNSHFFTANQGECDGLRAIETQQRASAGAAFQGWGFEGIAFYAVSAARGTCRAGYVPVYRFYNQRGEQNDSNHRFTTDAAAGASLVNLGWKDEGVAFCSVATSNAPPPPTRTDGEIDCGVFYATTKTLTYQVVGTGPGASGALETTTFRNVTRSVGPTRFGDQDALAVRSNTEGKPEWFTDVFYAANDNEFTTFGNRTIVTGLTAVQTYSPAPQSPRKWSIGQSVTNTYQIATVYRRDDGVSAAPGEVVSTTQTDTLLRRETVTTPAGTFTDACMIRSRTTFPQISFVGETDFWFVPGIGLVKSSNANTRSTTNGVPIAGTSETILVSAQ